MNFDFNDRRVFLGLLTEFEDVTRRRGMYLPLLSDVSWVLRDVCADADLSVYPGLLAFTAVDHYRYYASRHGLWRVTLVDDGCETFPALRVSARDWWTAVLQTRVHWMLINGRSLEVVRRSKRFLEAVA